MSQFIPRVQDALAPTTFWAGLIKAPVFAMLIALVGTYRGMQVRDSSRELGRLTTLAVVQSIFLVIFADAIFAVVFVETGFLDDAAVQQGARSFPVRNLVNRFGTQVVHDGVNLDVMPGEVLGIVGGSGSGKSVLLRTMLGLQRPASGQVLIEGRDITQMSEVGTAVRQAALRRDFPARRAVQFADRGGKHPTADS